MNVIGGKLLIKCIGYYVLAYLAVIDNILNINILNRVV